MHHRLRIFLLAVLVAFCVTPLQAHPHHEHLLQQASNAHGFSSGLLHPFSGLDHLLAMVAVGLLSVQVGGSALWAGPLSFLGGVTLGGLIGLSRHHLPGVEPVIAFSLVAMGLALALKRVPAQAYLCAAFVLFGSFHGDAHAQEIAGVGQAQPYIAGFVLGSALLHIAGILAGAFFKKSQSVVFANVLRASGASMAAAGLLFALQA